MILLAKQLSFAYNQAIKDRPTSCAGPSLRSGPLLRRYALKGSR